MRIIGIPRLVIIGLIAVFLGVGVVTGILVQTSAAPTEGGDLSAFNDPGDSRECGIPDPVGIDWSTSSDFQKLVDRSDLIIKGEVVSSAIAKIQRPDYPERLQTARRGFKEVSVQQTFKGDPPSDTIAIGQEAIERYEPQLRAGMTVYLFLEQVNHERLRNPVPFDYVIRGGPQGQFRVNDEGIIEPQGMRYLSTTVQFCGKTEDIMVQEIQRAVSGSES